jgi:nitrogen fixation/metabolism regulation signal transduction histidine kinase
MSLRLRFILSAMLLVLAGVLPIGWYAIGMIDRSIGYWHDAKVGEALQHGLVNVDDAEIRKEVNDALIRYKQIGALQRPLQRTMLIMGGAFTALILLLASILAWLLAVRMTRPLRSVAQAAQKIAQGDLSHTVPAAHVREIAVLVDAFNDMVMGLRDSREALARAERRAAWQDMARAIAHEIKNPLTPMRLTTQRLRERFLDNRSRFDESFMRSTDMILSEIDQLERLANAFSSFAKMPAPVLEPMDAREVVNVIGEVYGAERERGRLRLLLPEGPARILGDAARLQQALMNLVKNALEAVGDAEGRVTVALRTTEDEVIIEVDDTGPGIPEEVLADLFRPYVSTKPGGSGIGLAVVDRVITDHQGRVEAFNRKPHGATFAVHLPRAGHEATVAKGTEGDASADH